MFIIPNPNNKTPNRKYFCLMIVDYFLLYF
jgi:hypothetical protein